MTTTNRLADAPADSGQDDRKLSHAFLQLSMPFTVLMIVTLVTLWMLDFDRDTAGVVLSDTIERRQEAIMATPPTDAGALIAALQNPAGPWTEDEQVAVRSLLVRTGWPTGSASSEIVTNERLTTTDPSEWNGQERAVAVEILRDFERSWFSQAPR